MKQAKQFESLCKVGYITLVVLAEETCTRWFQVFHRAIAVVEQGIRNSDLSSRCLGAMVRSFGIAVPSL